MLLGLLDLLADGILTDVMHPPVICIHAGCGEGLIQHTVIGNSNPSSTGTADIIHPLHTAKEEVHIPSGGGMAAGNDLGETVWFYLRVLRENASGMDDAIGTGGTALGMLFQQIDRFMVVFGISQKIELLSAKISFDDIGPSRIRDADEIRQNGHLYILAKSCGQFSFQMILQGKQIAGIILSAFVQLLQSLPAALQVALKCKSLTFPDGLPGQDAVALVLQLSVDLGQGENIHAGKVDVRILPVHPHCLQKL